MHYAMLLEPIGNVLTNFVNWVLTEAGIYLTDAAGLASTFVLKVASEKSVKSWP